MIKNNIHSRKGFSLLEALLTTAVLSGLFFVVFGILQNYTEQILSKSTSNYLNNISSAIEDILQDPNNFEDIYAEVDAQTNDILEITVADIISGNIGTLTLPATSILNANTNATTPLKTGIEIMIRRAGTNSLEIIIATDRRIDDSRVRGAAEFSRLDGGFYRNTAQGIKNAYSAWSFNPNTALAGTNWWDNIANPNPPSQNDGSYLIHYKHINFDDIAGDYLYRTRVPGKPELNRLYADLNMGGQNIFGADDLDTVGNVEAQDNLIVNGTMNVNEDTSINQGNLRAFNTLSTNNASINNLGGGTTGNFIVQNQLGINSLNLSTSVEATNATFTSGLATTGDLSSDIIQSVDSINSVDINVENLSGVSLKVTGNLNVGELITPTLSIGGAGREIFSENLVIDDQMTIGGTLGTTDFTINDLNTAVFGACDENALSDC